MPASVNASRSEPNGTASNASAASAARPLQATDGAAPDDSTATTSRSHSPRIAVAVPARSMSMGGPANPSMAGSSVTDAVMLRPFNGLAADDRSARSPLSPMQGCARFVDHR